MNVRIHLRTHQAARRSLSLSSSRYNAGVTRIVLSLILALCCTALVFAGEFDPETGWYIRFDAGTSIASDPELRIPDGPLPADLGESTVFGGGIGYSLVSGLSADFTVLYRSGFEQVSGFPDMPTGRADFESLTGLVSLYMDAFTFGRVNPYFGFGIGAARNKLGTVRITNTDGSPLGTIGGKTTTNFAWHVSAGLEVLLSERFSLLPGYRYLRAGDYESRNLLVFTDGSVAQARNEARFHASEFQLSVKIFF